MSDTQVTCPHCNAQFALTESLAAPLIAATRKEYEQRLATERDAIEAKQTELATARAALAKEKAAIDDRVAEQLATERKQIAADEAKKARRALADDIDQKTKESDELKALLQSKDEKLAEARKQEAEFRRKQRELDEQKADLDVELEKRLAAAIAPEREKARRAADETYSLKLAEEQAKSKKLLEQLEDAKRRAEQGSQQMQGEIQELDLEQRLRDAFPLDAIEPVAKGQFGGDALQRVSAAQGHPTGTILWESKRTKNWTASWLDKLKQDQRAAKADIAVIVTQAMPAGDDTFAEVGQLRRRQ